MSSPTVVSETLASQLLPIVKEIISQEGQALGPGSFTVPTVVLVAMQAVEKYSDTISRLSGPDKLQTAKVLIPQILSVAVEQGMMTQNQCNTLSMQLNGGIVVVEQLIEAYVLLSKNPQIIQAVQVTEEAVRGCCGKIKAWKNRPRV